MRTAVLLGILGMLPTSIARAEPKVLPHLYATGNLRVDVACADYAATPERGLAITLDGTPIEALRTNGATGIAWSENGPYSVWEPTDIGFLVEPGRHRVTIAAPGCAPTMLDVDAPADHAELATGRLAIADGALLGPVGAPNGFGLTLGILSGPAMNGPSDHGIGGFATGYTYDPGNTSRSAWIGMSIERRHVAFSIDNLFGYGTTSGTAVQTMTIGPDPDPGPFHFTGDTYQFAMTARFGARIPLHDVALAAGSGIGFQSWFISTKLTDATTTDLFVDPPDTIDASWIVPLWAGATIKPSCNWGVQVLAQYDIHPTATQADGLELGAGFLYQPSDACSTAPGVRVAPI